MVKARSWFLSGDFHLPRNKNKSCFIVVVAVWLTLRLLGSHINDEVTFPERCVKLQRASN